MRRGQARLGQSVMGMGRGVACGFEQLAQAQAHDKALAARFEEDEKGGSPEGRGEGGRPRGAAASSE